jgi:hypothetical protein
MAYRIVMLALAVALARPAAAQGPEPAFEIAATFVTTSSGQFHTRDIGGGARVGWRMGPLLTVEGELTYHADPFRDAVLFSAGRTEALFGATVGPRLGALRPFASLRPGFVRYRAPDEPFACITIFPPPLSCMLAGGRTLFAFDVGGGVEFFPSRRTVVRASLSDRIVRYPGPAYDTSGERREKNFAGHDPRVALSAGFRF